MEADQIDSQKLVENVLSFGIPTVILACIGCLILLKLRGDITFPGRFFVLQKVNALRTSINKSWARYTCITLLLLFVLAPIALLITWSVTALVELPPLYGLTVLFIGGAITIFTWAFISWSYHGFKWSLLIATMLTLGCTVVLAFLAVALFLVSDLTYMGISIICLTFSLLPMISVVALLIYADSWSLPDFGIETSVPVLLLQRWPLLVMATQATQDSLDEEQQSSIGGATSSLTSSVWWALGTLAQYTQAAAQAVFVPAASTPAEDGVAQTATLPADDEEGGEAVPSTDTVAATGVGGVDAVYAERDGDVSDGVTVDTTDKEPNTLTAYPSLTPNPNPTLVPILPANAHAHPTVPARPAPAPEFPSKDVVVASSGASDTPASAHTRLPPPSPASPLPLTALGLREPRSPLATVQVLALWVLAWVLLWVYAALVNVLLDTEGSARAGYVTAAGVLLIDALVVLAVFAGRVDSVLVCTAVFAIARVLFVVFGDQYYFLGQAFVYLCLSTGLAVAVAARYSPALDSTDLHAQLLAAADVEEYHTACAAATRAHAAGAVVDASHGASLRTHTDAAVRAGIVVSGEVAAGLGAQALGVECTQWVEGAITAHPAEAQPLLSRIARGLRLHTDAVGWVLVTLAFSACIIVAHSTSLPPVRLEQTHAQWVVMLAALAVAAVVLGAALLKVMYDRMQALTARLCAAAVVWVACVAALGVGLFLVSDSAVVLEVFCAAPTTVLAAYVAYVHGLRHGLDAQPSRETATTASAAVSSTAITATDTPADAAVVTVPAVPADADTDAGAAAACLTALGSAWAGYRTLLSALFLFLAAPLIAAGVTSAFVNTVWHAWLPAVLFIGCPAAAIAILWAVHFRTLSAPLLIATALAVAPVAAGLLLFYLLPHADSSALWPAVLAVGWAVLCCVFAACVLITHSLGKVTLVAGLLLALAVLLLFLLFLAVAIYVTPWTVGVALAVALIFAVVIAVFLLLAWPRLKARFPAVRPLYLFAPVAVLVLLFAIFVGIAQSHGFLGFSLGWMLLFVLVLLVVIGQHTDASFFTGSQAAAFGIVFSEHVFPAISLDHSTDPPNIKVSNLRVGLPLFAAVLLFLWGVIAAFFLVPVSIGLSVCCLAIIAVYALASTWALNSRYYFSRALRALALRCPAQLPALLAQAQAQALRHQLNIAPRPAAQLHATHARPQLTPAGTGAQGVSSPNGPDADTVAARLGAWADVPAVVRAAWQRARAERSYNVGEGVGNRLRSALTGAEPFTFDQLVTSPDEASLLDPAAAHALRELVLRALETPLQRDPSDQAVRGPRGGATAAVSPANTEDGVDMVEVVVTPASPAASAAVSSADTAGEAAGAAVATDAAIALPARTWGGDSTEVFDVLSHRLSRASCYAVLHHLDAHLDALHLLSASLAAEVAVAVVRLAAQVEAARCQTLQNVLRRATPALADVRADNIPRIEALFPLAAQRLASVWHSCQRQAALEQARSQAEKQAREAAQATKLREAIARQQAENEARCTRLWAMVRRRAYDKDVFMQAFEDAVRTATTARQEAANAGNAEEEAFWTSDLARVHAAERKRAAEERAACALCAGRGQCSQEVSGAGTSAHAVLQEVFGCEDCDMLVCGVCVQAHRQHSVLGPIEAVVVCETVGESSGVESDIAARMLEQATQPLSVDTPSQLAAALAKLAAPPDLPLAAHQALHGSAPYVDPAFPATAATLAGAVPEDMGQRIEWKRLSQLCPGSAPMLFAAPLDASDMVQGRLGDCWLLASVAALAQRAPQRLIQVFLTREANRVGMYSVQLWVGLEQTRVTVDDMVPCVEKDGVWQPLFAQSRQPEELYVALLEKAFAKLYGSYAALISGFSDVALSCLTGGAGECLRFSDAPTQARLLDGSLFAELAAMLARGALLCCGSPPGSDSTVLGGVVQGHAYGLLDLREVRDPRTGSKVQLAKLANPWGAVEWLGDWSDNSPLWTPALRSQVGLTSGDDGVFWISFSDLAAQFSRLYICHVPLPPTVVHTYTLKSAWAAGRDGGCTNFPTYGYNPQFSLAVPKQANVRMYLVVADAKARRAVDSTATEVDFTTALHVCATRGRAVDSNCAQYPQVCSSGKYGYRTRAVQARLDATPADAPYTVVASTFDPGVHAPFWLRIESDTPVTIQPLALHHGFGVVTAFKGAFAGATSGGCINYDSVSNNPYWRVRVLRATTLRVLLTRREGSCALGCMLVQSGGAPSRRVQRVVGKSGYSTGSMGEMEVTLAPEDCADGPLTLFVSAFKAGDAAAWGVVAKWCEEGDIEMEAAAGDISVDVV